MATGAKGKRKVEEKVEEVKEQAEEKADEVKGQAKGLGARARAKARGIFPKIPDMGQLTNMMDDRFRQLTDRLDEMLTVLRSIDDKLGRGAGPT